MRRGRQLERVEERFIAEALTVVNQSQTRLLWR